MSGPDGTEAGNPVGPLARFMGPLFALGLFARAVFGHLHGTLFEPDRWRIGDWLINYSDGFVRRGLLGAIALGVGGVLPASLGPVSVWGFIVALQILAYATFFFVAARLFVRSRPGLLTCLLFFSPAFLLFPYLSGGGGFRKEILHFALFAVLCEVLARPTARRERGVAVAAVIVVPVLVLSHELLFCLVPYYLLVGWILLRGRGRVAGLAYAGALLAGASSAFALAFTHRGTMHSADVICDSLLEHRFPTETCMGAIAWMADSPAVCHARVIEMVTTQPGFVLPSLAVLVLAAAPLVYAFLVLAGAHRREALPTLLAAGASVTLMLPVAWVALDWGRLVHIQVATLTLLALAARAREQASVAPPVREPMPSWLSHYVVQALVVAVYATSWGVHSVYGSPGLVASGVAAKLVGLVHHSSTKDAPVSETPSWELGSWHPRSRSLRVPPR